MWQVKKTNKNEKKKKIVIYKLIKEKKLDINETPAVSGLPKILSGDPSVPPTPEGPQPPNELQNPKEPCPNEEKPTGAPTEPPIVNIEKQSSYEHKILGLTPWRGTLLISLI